MVPSQLLLHLNSTSRMSGGDPHLVPLPLRPGRTGRGPAFTQTAVPGRRLAPGSLRPKLTGTSNCSVKGKGECLGGHGAWGRARKEAGVKGGGG